MTDIIRCPYCNREFPLVVVVKDKKETERQEKIPIAQAPITEQPIIKGTEGTLTEDAH